MPQKVFSRITFKASGACMAEFQWVSRLACIRCRGKRNSMRLRLIYADNKHQVYGLFKTSCKNTPLFFHPLQTCTVWPINIFFSSSPVFRYPFSNLFWVVFSFFSLGKRLTTLLTVDTLSHKILMFYSTNSRVIGDFRSCFLSLSMRINGKRCELILCHLRVYRSARAQASFGRKCLWLEENRCRIHRDIIPRSFAKHEENREKEMLHGTKGRK